MAIGEYTERRTYSEAEYKAGKFNEDAKQIRSQTEKKYGKVLGRVKYKQVSNTPQSITNPLKDAPYGSAFMLDAENPIYYLKFGYLLEYIRENIIPRVKISKTHSANPPMFDIDTNSWDNYMYSLPNQISLDPKVCIVRNDNFNSSQGITQCFQNLQFFREEDISGRSNRYSALPLNIYLNFDFIQECLKKDDRGDVNVYEFISSICTGLNKALGGINNLEPIIDEDTNTLKIIDSTPIPGHSGRSPEVDYSLQLYGYDKGSKGYTSNFIRKVDLKTAITPEYATMITVGATAGGYVKGTEATAFSKWNIGLTDRYKEDFTPGNENSLRIANEEDEAETNYGNEFLRNGYASRYGFSRLMPGKFKLVDDLIAKNLSVVTEYYKYILSKNKNESGGTIGFIPFKLSFTMDGLSGIKIYNKLRVNTEFLPRAYGDNADLIVTGVTHKLSNNDWETDIEATIIPKSTNLTNVSPPNDAVQESIDNFVDTNPQPIKSNPKEEDKIITMMNILINEGKLNKFQAAAIAGNIKAESGFKEWNVEDGKTSKYLGSGIGLMQWTDVSGQRNGRYNFEQYVGKWLVANKIDTPYVKNNALDTNPKNYQKGTKLEASLKTIPKLFEAESSYVLKFITQKKPAVMKNFKGNLSGNSYTLVKNGLFKYAVNGKIKQDLGGYTEIFLVDGETPSTVLAARKGNGKAKYHKEVDHRVRLAMYCLEVYNKSK